MGGARTRSRNTTSGIQESREAQSTVHRSSSWLTWRPIQLCPASWTLLSRSSRSRLLPNLLKNLLLWLKRKLQTYLMPSSRDELQRGQASKRTKMLQKNQRLKIKQKKRKSGSRKERAGEESSRRRERARERERERERAAEKSSSGRERERASEESGSRKERTGEESSRRERERAAEESSCRRERERTAEESRRREKERAPAR